LLQKFQQIIVEFHGLQKEVENKQYAAATRNILNAGFRVAHLHGNNFSGMYKVGEDEVPNVLEVTYISTGTSQQPCIDHEVLLPDDAVNRMGGEELHATLK